MHLCSFFGLFALLNLGLLFYYSNPFLQHNLHVSGSYPVLSYELVVLAAALDMLY